MGSDAESPGELKQLASTGRGQLRERLYTVSEIMRLTAMTRRQVIYLAEIGLVCPRMHDPSAGTGQAAYFYSADEVVKAMVIAELRGRGLSPKQVQQVASNLREHGRDLFESTAYLLTDGYSVYYAFSEHEAVDILKQHRQGLLLVPIYEQVAKLREVA